MRIILFALALVLVAGCRAAGPDTAFNFSGLAVVRHDGNQWICAFTKEHFNVDGYKATWRLTLSPWDPSFLKGWYGDKVYVGKVQMTGTKSGHAVFQFDGWYIDMLSSDVTLRQQIALEGVDHSGETGIQTVVITGGLDQFVIIGKEPL